MTFTGRRVVTGHTPDGKSTVLFDPTLELFGATQEAGNEARKGAASRVYWTTAELPANNDGTTDMATQEVATALDAGSLIRIVRYSPGVTPRRHRTSSVDYVVVLSGSIKVQLDDQTVELKEGDVLIQRGTVHNWINDGTEPCVMFYAMTGARPVSTNGKVLWPQG